ncbi:hypothetical protein B7435_16695 [Mycolicibacterium peregrinum]|nr:hypothetical protein B7435_16695 [Mycolicibacterium peregrinum]
MSFPYEGECHFDADEYTLVKGDENPQVNTWSQIRAQSGQGVYYLTEPGFYDRLSRCCDRL